MNKEKFVRGFILSTMIGLYVIVSLISTLHVIEFFEMSNPRWLAISLAIAFEIGAAASLASIIVLEKTSKTLVWSLFILLTAMQIQGNMFYAYTHLENFQDWIELFGLQEEELITQKRILSIVSGAILPIIALGFIKSLVDYIKPAESQNQLAQTEILSEEIEEDRIKETVKPIAESIDQNVESPPKEKESYTEDHRKDVPNLSVTDSDQNIQEVSVKPIENEIQPDVLPESPTINNAKIGNVVITPNISNQSKS